MLEWLEATSIAVTIRHSTWLYPIIEIFHITGIVLLAGPAFMFDMRLLGLSKSIPVSVLGKHLLPWSRRGLFILVIPSGVLLFISNAETVGTNPVFWLKMLLLAIGILNTVWFHHYHFSVIDKWDENTKVPSSAKAVACISLVIWICVIACGRLLAYY